MFRRERAPGKKVPGWKRPDLAVRVVRDQPQSRRLYSHVFIDRNAKKSALGLSAYCI
jgi:hypothetical protein